MCHNKKHQGGILSVKQQTFTWSSLKCIYAAPSSAGGGCGRFYISSLFVKFGFQGVKLQADGSAWMHSRAYSCARFRHVYRHSRFRVYATFLRVTTSDVLRVTLSSSAEAALPCCPICPSTQLPVISPDYARSINLWWSRCSWAVC